MMTNDTAKEISTDTAEQTWIQEQLRLRKLDPKMIGNSGLLKNAVDNLQQLMKTSQEVSLLYGPFKRIISHMENYIEQSSKLKRSMLFKRTVAVNQMLPVLEHTLASYENKTPEIEQLGKRLAEERPQIESLRWCEKMNKTITRAVKEQTPQEVISYLLANHQELQRHIEQGGLEQEHRSVMAMDRLLALIRTELGGNRADILKKIEKRLKNIKLKKDTLQVFQKSLAPVIKYTEDHLQFTTDELASLKNHEERYRRYLGLSQHLTTEQSRVRSIVEGTSTLKDTGQALSLIKKARALANSYKLDHMTKELKDESLDVLLANNKAERALLGSPGTSGYPAHLNGTYLDASGVEQRSTGTWTDAQGNAHPSILELIESTKTELAEGAKEEKTWKRFREFFEKKEVLLYLSYLKQWDKDAYERLNKIKTEEDPPLWEKVVRLIRKKSRTAQQEGSTPALQRNGSREEGHPARMPADPESHRQAL